MYQIDKVGSGLFDSGAKELQPHDLLHNQLSNTAYVYI